LKRRRRENRHPSVRNGIKLVAVKWPIEVRAARRRTSIIAIL
jgi:hypothetical protein